MAALRLLNLVPFVVVKFIDANVRGFDCAEGVACSDVPVLEVFVRELVPVRLGRRVAVAVAVGALLGTGAGVSLGR